MIRLVLRPAARQDIADIWLHTADRWGADQADSYVSNIDREIAQALSFPAIGSPVEGQSNEYRKLPAANIGSSIAAMTMN